MNECANKLQKKLPIHKMFTHECNFTHDVVCHSVNVSTTFNTTDLTRVSQVSSQRIFFQLRAVSF